MALHCIPHLNGVYGALFIFNTAPSWFWYRCHGFTSRLVTLRPSLGLNAIVRRLPCCCFTMLASALDAVQLGTELRAALGTSVIGLGASIFCAIGGFSLLRLHAFI